MPRIAFVWCSLLLLLRLAPQSFFLHHKHVPEEGASADRNSNGIAAPKLQARIHFPSRARKCGFENNREQKTLCRRDRAGEKRVKCRNAFDRLKKQLDFLRPPMFAPERAKKAIIKRLLFCCSLTMLGKTLLLDFFSWRGQKHREKPRLSTMIARPSARSGSEISHKKNKQKHFSTQEKSEMKT